MGKSISTAMPPIPVKRALNKLGRDIRDARRRRWIPQRIKSVSNWKKNVCRSAYDDRAKPSLQSWLDSSGN
jgi:hypothetical protein